MCDFSPILYSAQPNDALTSLTSRLTLHPNGMLGDTEQTRLWGFPDSQPQHLKPVSISCVLLVLG